MTAPRDTRSALPPATLQSASAANVARPWVAGLLLAFMLATLASVLPYLSVLRDVHQTHTVFWPPNGILTVLFLVTQGRVRRLSVAVAIVANFFIEFYVGQYSLVFVTMTTAFNISTSLAIAAMTRRFCGPEIDLSQLNTLCRFAGLCVIPVIAAAVSLICLVSQIVLPSSFWPLWRILAMQEVLGVIMVAPALYTIARPRDRGLFVCSPVERVTLFALLLGVESALFGLSSTPALFVVPPVLVGISYRLGPRAAAQAILATSMAAFGFTIAGTGPFASFHQANMFGVGALLQVFILAVVFTVLPAAGAVARRLRAEEELKRVHRELVDASRLAGRAEIANNVLHNVGNVLNSVNVSAELIGSKLRDSKAAGLEKAVNLMNEHAADLGSFISVDERGKALPGYLNKLVAALAREKQGITDELDSLTKSVDHIKEIVAMQQSYSGATSVTEPVQVRDLLEDALRMNIGSIAHHQISIVKEFEEVPSVLLDKNLMLQILINLIGNAKHAINAGCQKPHQIKLRMDIAEGADKPRLRIRIEDNGEGIAPENLTRLFAHGFTTRKNGHGFGLHSCALAVKEMKGSINAFSDGLGQGAAFVIELPLSRVPEST